MKRNVRVLAVLVLAGAALSACRKKPPPAAPQPDQPTRPPATTPTSGPGPTAPPATTGPDANAVLAILNQMVFFDYDESTIRADAQQTLAAKVPHLRSSPSIRVRIDGHADERGSVEYNLALGMRRAQAVRQYLMDFGLDAARFETNSFGEDRPLVPGGSETAWSQNRRAEFRVTTGTVGR
jgi:peptidoglycan-associated lipoprotein